MANGVSPRNECFKLSWFERIGYCSGDLAQNLIYQTVSIWLLIFYTDVYGLRPEVAAVMFLVVRIIDVIWDPMVGVLVDKSSPRWGKYRSWIILAGLPLAAFASLCFWNGFSGSLLYAYITYVGLSMCFTFINVPYGALGASLTRDTQEITILTSVRMFMANAAGLIVKTLPLLVALFADPARGWFCSMTVFAAIGLSLLILTFATSRERIDVSRTSAESVKVKDLWMELVHNRPLRVLSLFFIVAFITMSISNAADSYFMTYSIGATPLMTTAFMWLGTIPAFIFMPLVPAMKKRLGKNRMFKLFLGIAIAAMAAMYVCVRTPRILNHFWVLCVVQFVKSTGILVATGYMWALVPEVVSYGEHVTGRRVAGIVNALICIFMKAGMALGGAVPGLVLAWVGFQSNAPAQTPLAMEGILWLVTLIPAALLFVAMFIIGKYELTDERMEEINRAAEIS